jgi:hypothetical protein
MGKKQQDQLQRAKECYADVRDLWQDNRRRMLDDLRFSNPVEPEQWDADALTTRKGRPCLTLDRTNQYIVQVINTARMNKPGINCMPADSRADVDVAEALDGIIRHIEYRSGRRLPTIGPWKAPRAAVSAGCVSFLGSSIHGRTCRKSASTA